jgi:hypothetical protein
VPHVSNEEILACDRTTTYYNDNDTIIEDGRVPYMSKYPICDILVHCSLHVHSTIFLFVAPNSPVMCIS